MQMLKHICLVGFLLLCFFELSGQIKSGPIVTISNGWLEKGPIFKGGYGEQNGLKDGKWKNRISFQIGYQFLFPLKNNFSINTSLLYQSRGVHIAYNRTFEDSVNESKYLNALSMNIGINYSIISKIPIGIGLEPTYYFNTDLIDNLEKNKIFDVPICIKVGYEFRLIEIALSYKHGFNSLYRNSIVSKATTRDIQLSIFIPISFK